MPKFWSCPNARSGASWRLWCFRKACRCWWPATKWGTQNGNNNAYCQDNEISWCHWDLSDRQQELLAFTRRILEIYHDEPVFHRRRFFHGMAIEGEEARDIAWLNPDGNEIAADAW